MPDFTVRSDAVNVEQIMEQIRARIQEKRGVDYTEQQIHELASVKLEKFLDPRGLRSDLLDQWRKQQRPAPPNYAFEDSTLFDSHRGSLRWIRKLLQPILKMFFNPNPLIQALHIQSKINNFHAERLALDPLYFEVLHNIVLETTRLAIENKNLKMRVESLTSRLEFNERRARSLESVVVYKAADTDFVPDEEPDAPLATDRGPGEHGPTAESPGPGQRSRRRRRRRGRRGNAPAATLMGGPGASSSISPESAGEDAAGEPEETDDAPSAAFDEGAEPREADSPNEPPADGTDRES